LADAGEKRARRAALEEAIVLAEQRYADCPNCKKTVCEDCWNPRTQQCVSCDGQGEPTPSGRHAPAAASGGGHAGPGLACPNCRTALGGGRFCAECGFDMASTHKSCPGCGAMCTRAARFCPECGHGF
jgi:Double zinc ribbon